LIEIDDTGESKENDEDSHDPSDNSFESLFLVVLANILPFDIIRL